MGEIVVTKIKLSSLFLLFALHSFGQDTTCQINTSWTGLKKQLQRRSDIAVNLTAVLSKTKEDKEQLNSLKASAIDLFKYVDTLCLRNSMAISLAETKNNKLTESLASVLIEAENDKIIRTSQAFIDIMIQLEGCENRIALAEQDYNNACKTRNRTDLLFKEEKIKKAEEIKF